MLIFKFNSKLLSIKYMKLKQQQQKLYPQNLNISEKQDIHNIAFILL